MLKPAEKRALIDWDEFIEDMNRDAPVASNETEREKRKRIAALEADHEAWFRYYFSKYYTSDPANFHKRSTKRVMENPEHIEARPWSRELSKSGRTMMEALKLFLTGKKKSAFLVSATQDAADLLAKPYKLNLEKNQRIINDYGNQVKHGDWATSRFVSKKGFSMRAIGKGGNPRGSREEEVRPDLLIVDDYDTDESCRNPDRVEQDWEWLERAFYATRSISVPLLMIFNGNIIAKDCCMVRAIKIADHAEIVNIRDKNGKSTWPQKNTEAMIDRALKPLSYFAIQQEYYNNPITKGKVFQQLNYKKLPPLSQYKFLVAYTDPSYKSGKKNDYKATCLIGKWQDEYHVRKMYCDQTTTAQMLDWQYEIIKDVNGKVPVYFVIEWPWIDDTLKLEIKKANERHKLTLPLMADPRDKPDKFYRIESKLEPLNRNEKLWFEERLKDSKHMTNTEDQFLALSPTSKAHDDAPDAVEGGAVFIDHKVSSDTSQIQTNAGRRTNNKRW